MAVPRSWRIERAFRGYDHFAAAQRFACHVAGTGAQAHKLRGDGCFVGRFGFAERFIDIGHSHGSNDWNGRR
ncbi:hypothetical protein [Trinickia sp. EG282A]|uniref:hypothetical protein n=1 Tax=Trinickia sp. EG282A TaxID=3237013 RepID=UPI0034D15550